LSEFRLGNRRVLEDVYREHAQGVAEFLRRGFSFNSRGRTLQFEGYRHPFDLDNALQETFLRAFQESARHAYDGVRSYRNYLLAIARNLVMDRFRRDPEPTTQSDTGENTIADEPNAEDRALELELTVLVRRFATRLAGAERRFFELRFFDHKTRSEVASECALTPMRARTLEHRLRRSLLDYLREQGYLEGDESLELTLQLAESA
jgi:RNA polymerase sigma factor (sigma-70 family)